MKLQQILFTLFFFGLTLLNLVCLGFFTAKYLYFKQIEFEIPLNNIEYVYLVLILITFLKDVTLSCAAFRSSLNLLNPRQQIITQFLLLIAWALVSAIYTKLELKDTQIVPIMCPSNFDYEKPEYITACNLRKLSFIIMWSYTGMLCISVLSAIFFNSAVDDDEEECNNHYDNNNNNNNNYNDEKFKPQLSSNDSKNITPMPASYSNNNNINRYNRPSTYNTNSSTVPYINISHLK